MKKENNDRFFNIFKKNNGKHIFGFKKDDNDNVKFYLPNFIFNQLSKQNKSNLYILKKYIKLLQKYNKNNINNKHKSVSMNNNKIQDANNLLSYLALIEDYQNNPDFHIYNKTYNKSSKKIDWKKTIDKNNVFIINKKPIYNDLLSIKKIKDIDHEFYLLYKQNINNAFELFFGYKIFKDVKKTKLLNVYHKEINIIRNFLDTKFKDRDIFIAKTLKNIYESRSQVSIILKKGAVFDNTEEINLIWETMIASIINSDVNSEREKVGKITLTQAGKEINLNQSISENKGLIIEIDHFIKSKNNKKGFILDSKFYSTYENLKKNNKTDIIHEDYNSAAINKQETYKRIYKEKYKNLDIYNFFILPKIDDNTNPIHFANHQLINNKKDYLIHLIALDFNEVVDKYINNEKNYEDFISLLESVNK